MHPLEGWFYLSRGNALIGGDGKKVFKDIRLPATIPDIATQLRVVPEVRLNIIKDGYYPSLPSGEVLVPVHQKELI
jgi:hypothetical protein